MIVNMGAEYCKRFSRVFIRGPHVDHYIRFLSTKGTKRIFEVVALMLLYPPKTYHIGLPW
jgi:hypothetical protein